MSDAKTLQRLIAYVAAVGILLLYATGLATGRSDSRSGMLRDDVAKLIGNWTGESICVGNNPACHDEKVVYHISRSTDDAGQVIIAANKIVDGKPEPMYVLDFKYDAAKRTLVGEFQNSRYHGVWEYTVRGNAMEGTLSLLPARTIVRRVKIKKDE
ncbi:MAG TPA: hypothetical protein VGO91_16590 [Pyrinomonadaceae bacterium]|jgi:hypothetical protein|nr:hypothetical protein [Pyrinomonadaceae bacterium]